MDLNWEPVILSVQKAREQFVSDLWLEPDRPIAETLLENFGIDVTDRRQLNYLMQCLGLYTPVLAESALALESYDYFMLDQMGANLLGFAVLQSSAGLLLSLSEYLPPAVRKRRLTREVVHELAINPSQFNWATVAPRPAQVKRYDRWRQATATQTPGLIAAADQAHAAIHNLNSDGLLAYMSMVACFFLMVLATSGHDPAEVADESAERFRDVVLVTIYKTLPLKYQSLGTGG